MSDRRSKTAEADYAAWASYTSRVAPLPGSRRAPAPNDEAGGPPIAVARPPEPSVPMARATAALPIGAPPAGLDGATWQRFRTGKLPTDRRLDLHGHTAQRAFHALASFLRAAHAEHLRCVEIITGRGAAGGGVIRREVPLWLNLPELRPLVLAAAHPHAANPGSIRLLLRRARR